MELEVLGPVRLARGGRDFPLGSGKQREIAVLLALEEGRPLSRETIVDTVWNGGIGALSTLDSYISRTRRYLEAAGADRSALTCDRGHYALRLGPGAVDWNRFRRLRDRARAHERAGEREAALELLERALGLWRGTPLTGLSGDWAQRRRASMDLARLDAAADRGRLLLESGRDPRDLLDALTAEAERHPDSEPAALNLATALLRAGHRAEAAGVCRRLADHLRERDMAPSPAVRHLQREAEGARGGRPSAPQRGAAAPPPDTLPRDLHDFHGRAAEVERIGADLRAGAAAVVVSGMPGVGKTALVCRAARRLSGDFPDGRILVDLHGSGADRAPRAPAEALHEMLAQLGVPAADLPEGTGARVRLWRTLTAPLRLLAVFDDAAGAEQVRPLLPGGAHSAALVTSRVRMPSLEGSRTLGLVAPDAEEAVGLVAAITGCDPHRDAAGLSALARRMDRLPHPLRLLASWWRHAHPSWPLGHLVEHLEDTAPRFTGPTDAALATSVLGLPPAARAAFVRLGLLPSTAFGTHAAAAAIGATAREAEPVLEVLAERSLLEEPGPPGRWGLHALTADFARRTAEEELGSVEAHSVRSRAMGQWLAAAEAADRARFPYRHRRPSRPGEPPVEAPRFERADQAEAWFAAERDTLVDLLPGSGGSGPPATGEAFAWHRAELALRLAGFLPDAGVPDREAAAFEGAAQTFRAHGDTPGTALALNALAAVRLKAGALEEAEAAADGAAECARSCGDRTALARSSCLRGWVLILLRRPENALRVQMEALATARLGGHRPTIAEVLHAAAVCHSDLGQAGPAVGRFYEALGHFEALDDPVGRTQARGNLARALRRSGRLEEARRVAEEALRLAQGIGSSRWEGRMLDNLGEILAAAGDHHAARRRFRDALRTARDVGDVETEADALANLGETATALGDPGAALDHLTQAMGTMLASGAPGDLTGILISQGDANRELRAVEEAENRYRQALRTARTPGDRERAASALESLALLRGIEPPPSAHCRQAGRDSGFPGGSNVP